MTQGLVFHFLNQTPRGILGPPWIHYVFRALDSVRVGLSGNTGDVGGISLEGKHVGIGVVRPERSYILADLRLEALDENSL